MKYCSKCGEQNPDEAKFCSSCGEPLTAKKEVANNISATWDLNEAYLDQIKVIFADGYNIEAEYESGEDSANVDSCLSIDFLRGKLDGIDYKHPNSQVALCVGFTPEVITHFFKPDEYTGKILHTHNCYDNSGRVISDDEWWRKYGKMFYEDVEPLRAKLTEFFGFDIIEDKYWEDR